MDALVEPLIPLGDLPIGATAQIVRILGGRDMARRLVALGLRPGSEVTVLHLRGRGVLLSCGETRIALGGGVAEKVLVAVQSSSDDASLSSDGSVRSLKNSEHT